jgi:hypothetical protein
MHHVQRPSCSSGLVHGPTQGELAGGRTVHADDDTALSDLVGAHSGLLGYDIIFLGDTSMAARGPRRIRHQ